MFTPSFIIEKKRDGKELSPEEVNYFIHGLFNGNVADYQASAFLMAVYFKGMSLNETVALTQAMLSSGDRFDLNHISGKKVDKHSTGGVGDKVSLILTPLAAACGLKVPMMAGRGLGHSGGTLDKLESIPGFNVKLDPDKFMQTLSSVGCAIMGQTEKMVPADKKLYALRDVTGTVECIPLITASILSKKLAEGTEGLVLDVKVGSGAFMKTQAQAKLLAKTLIQVAKKMKLPCRALLSNMNQPLGYSVGNTLEILEAIEVLKSEKNTLLCSVDLKELTIQLCAQMLFISDRVKNLSAGRRLALLKLSDGSAWRIFQSLIQAQGGDLKSLLDRPHRLPIAPKRVSWNAKKKGYLTKINTEEIGKILIELGGGRRKASDSVDHGVGLVFHKKLGHRVQLGEALVTVYAQEKTQLALIESQFYQAVEISQDRKPIPKLIFNQF